MKCPECGSMMIFSPPVHQEGASRVLVCKNCRNRWTMSMAMSPGTDYGPHDEERSWAFVVTQAVKWESEVPEAAFLDLQEAQDYQSKRAKEEPRGTYGDELAYGVYEVPLIKTSNKVEKEEEPVQPEDWIDKIPMRLKQGLIRYRDTGRPTGSGLAGLLENDLRKFLNYADPETLSLLKELVWWLNRFMPYSAWGREDKVRGWIKLGGIEGAKEDNPEAFKHWERKTENELRELGRDSEV